MHPTKLAYFTYLSKSILRRPHFQRNYSTKKPDNFYFSFPPALRTFRQFRARHFLMSTFHLLPPFPSALFTRRSYTGPPPLRGGHINLPKLTVQCVILTSSRGADTLIFRNCRFNVSIQPCKQVRNTLNHQNCSFNVFFHARKALGPVFLHIKPGDRGCLMCLFGQQSQCGTD